MPTECKLEKEDWAHDEELGWFLKDTRPNLCASESRETVADGDEEAGVPGGCGRHEDTQE